MIATIIAIIALILAAGSALRYMIRQKKRGAKCIGCSAAGTCTYRTNEKAECGHRHTPEDKSVEQ